MKLSQKLLKQSIAALQLYWSNQKYPNVVRTLTKETADRNLKRLTDLCDTGNF
ncbi:hypothetical protein [Psychromonas sp. MME2]|uniref:hypothetical protein n=1 Tax=unclassified Psychromonas TaxID=2614957 RepID=UPI00339C0692